MPDVQYYDYCTPPPENCFSQHTYSTVTLNFDLLIPKSETFLSVPQCTNAVSVVLAAGRHTQAGDATDQWRDQ